MLFSQSENSEENLDINNMLLFNWQKKKNNCVNVSPRHGNPIVVEKQAG